MLSLKCEFQFSPLPYYKWTVGAGRGKFLKNLSFFSHQYTVLAECNFMTEQSQKALV